MAKRQLGVFSLSAIDLLCSSFGAMFVMAFMLSTVPTKESESTNRRTIVSFSTETTGSPGIALSVAYTAATGRAVSGESAPTSSTPISPEQLEGGTFSVLLPDSADPSDAVHVFVAGVNPTTRQSWRRGQVRVVARRIGLGKTETTTLTLSSTSGYVASFDAERLLEAGGLAAPLSPETALALSQLRARSQVTNPLAAALAGHQATIRSRSVAIQTAKGDGPALAESLARVGRGIYQRENGAPYRIEVLEASVGFPSAPHQLAVTDLSRRQGGLPETMQIIDLPQSPSTDALVAGILPQTDAVRLAAALPLVDMLIGLPAVSSPGLPRVFVGTTNTSALLVVSTAPWAGTAAVLTPALDRPVSSPVLVEPDIPAPPPSVVQAIIDLLSHDAKRKLLAVGSKGFAIQEGDVVRFIWTDGAKGETAVALSDASAFPTWARGAETPAGFSAEQWLMALAVTGAEYRRRVEGVLVDPSVWCQFNVNTSSVEHADHKKGN